MSDTPETDKQAIGAIGFYSCATVPADFARKLERERDEARARLKDIEDAMQAAENPHHDEVHCACVPLLRAALAEARGERDELRAVLESERDNWRAAAIQAVADRDRNKREWDKCAAELNDYLQGFCAAKEAEIEEAAK